MLAIDLPPRPRLDLIAGIVERGLAERRARPRGGKQGSPRAPGGIWRRGILPTARKHVGAPATFPSRAWLGAPELKSFRVGMEAVRPFGKLLFESLNTMNDYLVMRERA